jgi:hypothetical protein
MYDGLPSIEQLRRCPARRDPTVSVSRPYRRIHPSTTPGAMKIWFILAKGPFYVDFLAQQFEQVVLESEVGQKRSAQRLV